MKNAGIEFAVIPGVMKQMLNILLATFSYSVYLTLALFQTPGTVPDIAAWKDVGMGTAFIFVCVWMFRYFTTHIKELEATHREQLEKKDGQIEKMTDKVLNLSTNAIAAQTASNQIHEQVLKSLQTLNAKI